jgi:uncharacterized protein (TIGR03437 family)
MLTGLAALALSARAARVALPQVTGAPGASVIVPVTLDPEGASIGGLQFDIEYDAARFDLMPLVGDPLRSAAKVMFAASPAPNRRRFLITGFNREAIGAGVALSLLVRIRTAAAAGSYPLFFHGLIATDPYGRPANARAADGALVISGPAGSGPRLLREGVVNAASLRAEAVSPGAIVTLFGAEIGPGQDLTPLPPPAATELGGVSVRFDGIPAPLLYAGSGQINAIVPFAIAGRPRVNLEVLRNGQRIAALELEAAAAGPGIFTLDGSGLGQGAILNQDGTVNGWARPAEAGSIAVLFGAGFGVTSPALRDGEVVSGSLPSLREPVAVTVAGRPADVLYAGPAPDLVAGVFQVNFRIPAGAAAAAAAPVRVFAGGVAGADGVTLAVR